MDNEAIVLDPNSKNTCAEPDDHLIGIDGERHTLLDFWRWSFSDLCDDALKGQFTEWLVSLLVGEHGKRQMHWANTDLVSGTVRIEVKSSSIWQSWKLWGDGGKPKSVKIASEAEERRITFSGLMVHDNVPGSPPGYKSDLYIFAFQAQRDPRLWNALDLSQWEFYILTRAQLETVSTSSVSLKTVRRLAGSPMTASELRIKGREKISEIADQKKAVGAAAGRA